MDEEKIILTVIAGAYLLFGTFLAWVFGAQAGTFEWVAITVLWPLVALAVMFAAVLLIGALNAVFGGIRAEKE